MLQFVFALQGEPNFAQPTNNGIMVSVARPHELQGKVPDEKLTFNKYCIARKFRRVKFSRKLIRQSFRNFIFTDSDPIATINDINIVSRIPIRLPLLMT